MAGGPRSGRERKDHTPFEGADETFWRGHTFGVGKGLPFGVLATGVRSRRSQPAALVRARYDIPAPAALRNRRRVNVVLIVQLYTDLDLAPATCRNLG